MSGRNEEEDKQFTKFRDDKMAEMAEIYNSDELQIFLEMLVELKDLFDKYDHKFMEADKLPIDFINFIKNVTGVYITTLDFANDSAFRQYLEGVQKRADESE